MNKNLKDWTKLSKQIYKDNWKCVIATICVCFTIFLMKPLLSPVFIKGLFNRLSQGNEKSFWEFVGICLIVLFFVSAISYILIVFSDAWFIRLTDQGSINALKELYKIPYNYVENRFSKEEQFNRIMNGCSGATGVFALGTQMITAFLCCFIVFIMLISLSVWFLIPVLLLIGVECLRLKFEIPFYKKLQLSMEKTMAEVHGNLYAMVMEAEALSVMGERPFYEACFEQNRIELWNQKKQKLFIKTYWDMVSDGCMLISNIILYELLGKLNQINHILSGTVASSVQFLQAFQENLTMIRNNIGNLPGCFVTMNRLREILESPKVQKERAIQEWDNQEIAISIKDLTIEVEKKIILDHISVEIKRGEKVAILGANGSGKSTLLKAILGEYIVESGSISIFGKEHQNFQTEEKGKIIGYCPAINQLYSVSGEENVEMALWNKEEIKQLEESLRYKTPENMSEGEKKRISIIRAGVGRKTFILADEPEASLNQELADTYMEWLLKQAETVIVVTHRKESLLGFTRIIHMEDLKA